MEKIFHPTLAAQAPFPSPQPRRASIIIVSYNAREKLIHCLTTVLQTLPDEVEVLVVDNASAEGNAEMVDKQFPEVTLIRSSSNLGFAGGCNLGARQARGAFLVFLNPDTLVEKGWLESLLKPFDEHEKIGLVTAKIVLLDPPNQLNTCGCNIHITGLTLCRGMGMPRQTYSQPDEVSAVSGAAFAIRRELFESLGGFDEVMFLYMEDIDLSLRARLAGWTICYTPDSLVVHDYQLRVTPLKIFWQERNRYVMLLKNFKWRTLILLLPVYVLAEIITWSFVLLNDRQHLSNKLRAYRWLKANWSLVLSKRTETQRLRVVADRTLLKSLCVKLDFGQATEGLVATLANLLFTPLFFIWRSLLLLAVWW
ncbi:MAG: glycosyltransferase family 2 protein [Acidobacteria bacterium]|nr:glycosyltransferase family 2 protein [Acidobacteriota bacterium]